MSALWGCHEFPSPRPACCLKIEQFPFTVHEPVCLPYLLLRNSMVKQQLPFIPRTIMFSWLPNQSKVCRVLSTYAGTRFVQNRKVRHCGPFLLRGIAANFSIHLYNTAYQICHINQKPPDLGGFLSRSGGIRTAGNLFYMVYVVYWLYHAEHLLILSTNDSTQ